jgi:hypothetical protein
LTNALAPAGNQLINDNYHGDDKQEMDEAAGNVKREKAEKPENEQNYGDGPQHGISSRVALKFGRRSVGL